MGDPVNVTNAADGRDVSPAQPTLAPRPIARRQSRRGWWVAAFFLCVVLFWVVVAVLIGMGRASVRPVDDAPFDLDQHPIAPSHSNHAPSFLLPRARIHACPLAENVMQVSATYTGDEGGVGITVRRYADIATARAAVIPVGQWCPTRSSTGSARASTTAIIPVRRRESRQIGHHLLLRPLRRHH